MRKKWKLSTYSIFISSLVTLSLLLLISIIFFLVDTENWCLDKNLIRKIAYFFINLFSLSILFLFCFFWFCLDWIPLKELNYEFADSNHIIEHFKTQTNKIFNYSIIRKNKFFCVIMLFAVASFSIIFNVLFKTLGNEVSEILFFLYLLFLDL